MDKTKLARSLYVGPLAGIFSALLLVACGAGGASASRGGGTGGENGGSGGGSGGGPGQGSEDGGSASDIPQGAIAAELEVSLPTNDTFTLSGTFPVPKGVVVDSSGKIPYAIADYDGTLVETQVEIVTRYPDASDGADVVEVIGRVRRDPSMTTGQRATYSVLRANRDRRPDPGSPDVSDLQNGPVGVPSMVKDLLSDPTSIRISATDCFGNEYSVYPLDNQGKNPKLMRYGAAQAELRTFRTMAPDQVDNGPQGTLPHFFGVHSYLSTWSAENLLGLDLRFTNAHSGIDPADVMDDPLDTLYFDKIEVTIPSGWTLVQDFKDPYFGNASTLATGEKAFPIVKPLGDGTFHVIQWQGQFHRRLMLTPTGSSGGPAYAYLQGSGQGFCKRGTDPVNGHQLYSWWNLQTARYFPQSAQLPSLAHISNVNSKLQDAYDQLKDYLVNGTSFGNYPVAAEVMGWGHPYGVAYGGMTGGPEIFLFEGVDVAYAANKSGLMALVAWHRMHTDRMPLALYDGDGTPSSVEDWLVEVGNGQDYVPFEHYIRPFLNKDNPFNPGSAPRFQIDYVRGTGKQPYYEYDHFSYDPHDFQHYIRYTHAPKALLWLSNDSIARDDLELVAEMFRLSYHPYKNSSFGSVTGSGLAANIQRVADSPADGSPFGRGESWGTDSALAVYASGDDELRARFRPWFDTIMNTLADSQMCNGFLQTQSGSKFLGGKYRGRQAIEQAICENMLRGTLMTVYKDHDPAMAAVVEDILTTSFYAFISPMAWNVGEIAPRTYTAVGPIDYSKPPFCSANQIPSDGMDAGFEKYQNWSSFGYGYERTGDPVFLDQASIQLGGQDVLFGLESQYLGNIQNQAALLALVQRMNGDL